MKENNLLASVALFSNLYNSDSYKSIPDILAEFIRGAITFEQKYNFDSNELKGLLNRVFGFNIPESVLRTTLKNKMPEEVTRDKNLYHFRNISPHKTDNLTKEVDDISKDHQTIIQNLFRFIERKRNKQLTDEQTEKVIKNFTEFLLDVGYSTEYSDLISAFVISYEGDESFNKKLRSIKEGVILYQGINYTSDINQLGHWNDELTIYLSTEHLFNCLGYNGELFQDIFQDFYDLISEINSNYKGKLRGGRNKLIELKYLGETKNEVEGFFKTAESIKKGHIKLDPSKLAMQNILKNCNSISEIKSKQVNFFLGLKRKGILFQDFNFNSSNTDYNVVDIELIEQLKSASEEKGKYFDEYYCEQCLNIFTKINYFRKGNNSNPFEGIRHIYITENNFAKYLAHNNNVKFGDYDTAFAKDIDFAISKFWFKLKKGFNNRNELPKTFDVVNKAKIIISSHLNSSISDSYNKLQSEFKAGKLSKEEAVELSLAYKERPNSPENFTAENIDDTLNFLFDEQYLEDFLREKSRKQTLLEETLKEKEQLQALLNEIKEEEERKTLEIKNIEFEKRRIGETRIKIKNQLLQKNENLRYFLLTLFLTFLPIILGILFKSIKPINNWLQLIGDYQYIIWGILALVFLAELFGRSYIFDKPKVKDGWNWLKILISGERLRYEKELEDRFNNEYKE